MKTDLALYHLNVTQSVSHSPYLRSIASMITVIIGPDNGMSSVRRQAITWTNDECYQFDRPVPSSRWNTIIFFQQNVKTSSTNRRSFWSGLNVLRLRILVLIHPNTSEQDNWSESTLQAAGVSALWLFVPFRWWYVVFFCRVRGFLFRWQNSEL